MIIHRSIQSINKWLAGAAVAATCMAVLPVYAADAGSTNAKKAAKSADDAKASAAAAEKSAASAAESEKNTKSELDKAREAAKKIPNDRSVYLGDRIVFKQDTVAYLQRYTVAGADGKQTAAAEEIPVCVPGGTYLRGIGKDSPLFVPDCDWKQFFCHRCEVKPIAQCNSISVAAKSGSEADRAKTGANDADAAKAAANRKAERGAKCSASKGDYEDCMNEMKCREEDPDAPCLMKSSALRFDSDTLEKTPPSRYGFTYGGLVVPFKFQLTGKKEFKGSASAAPYMGYRLGFEAFGIELAPVGFAGVSNVSGEKKTTKDGKEESSTSDLAAFSYGGALIGVLKGSFQFGAVVGFDHVGSGQGFKYNDKPWLALELGYALN